MRLLQGRQFLELIARGFDDVMRSHNRTAVVVDPCPDEVADEAGRLAVRLRPSRNAFVIHQIEKGARVDVLDQRGDWCRIAYGDVDGWICTSAIHRGLPY